MFPEVHSFGVHQDELRIELFPCRGLDSHFDLYRRDSYARDSSAIVFGQVKTPASQAAADVKDFRTRLYVCEWAGKSAYAQRSLPLTQAVREMLERRRSLQSVWVFPTPTNPADSYCGSTLDHLHSGVRRALGLPREFVLHSLRHTMLSRLGESGADAFTIQRVAGHHSVTMSQRYVHPSRGSIESSFARFESVSQLPQNDAAQPEPVTNVVTLPLLPSPPIQVEGSQAADSIAVSTHCGPVAQW